MKIHSTSCPTANTRGFTWYKIEAIANGSNIGSFLEPEEHRGLADHSCRNHTVSIVHHIIIIKITQSKVRLIYTS